MNDLVKAFSDDNERTVLLRPNDPDSPLVTVPMAIQLMDRMKLEDEISRAMHDHIEVVQVNHNLTESITELRQVVEDHENEMKALRTDLNDMCTNYEEVEKEQEEIQAKYNAVCEELEEASNDVVKLQEQVDAYRTRLLDNDLSIEFEPEIPGIVDIGE